MPILDLQRRARELGRIRIGQAVPITKRNGEPGTRPEKLDRFRLTSASRPLLERVAELYGGQVQDWTPQGGGPAGFEVVTDTNRIPILVPPQPVTQWMELWSGGGCRRRCDTVTELITGDPCICRANEQDMCKPTTRLNVVLRDVEGIGVWRLETHGWNAALELPDAAAFLAQAGGYVDGHLTLEERKRVVDGKTNRFMVPGIEISVTPAELLTGKGILHAPAVGGPVERPALPAGTQEPTPPADTTAPASPGGDPYAPAYELLEAATSLEELAGLWDMARQRDLVGPTSVETPPREAFVDAWKIRAHDIQRATATDTPPPTPVEVAPAAPAVEEDTVDPDFVWGQIVTEAGKLDPPMTTGDLVNDFTRRLGMAPGSASAGELQGYLLNLKADVAAVKS